MIRRFYWSRTGATLDNLPDRFLMRVTVLGPDDCWPWIGSRFIKGYGNASGLKPRLEVSAHRVAYRLFVGPIPEGNQVMHTCDNPPCCNPAHLRTGTNADNIHDKYAKGRGVNLTGEAHGMCVLSDQQVREIRASSLSQRELARRYGVVQSHIWRIRHDLNRKDA